MKIGQYCQRQRCKHVELEQFWQAFASRGSVSDSWAFLCILFCTDRLETGCVFFMEVKSVLFLIGIMLVDSDRCNSSVTRDNCRIISNIIAR